MRLTSSFAVFRADPSEQDLARARWLAREGRTAAAEQEYRTTLSAHPDLASGWIELVELLRRDARHEAALRVAREAEEHFGPHAAMPLVLRGAALSELGRTREAVQALEAALERDGNLALAWHELAYAAFKVGELSRALLALDRAFALEPHVDTLLLRGRILREAGQYEAAEVAFEAVQQVSEHDVPQRDAEREARATRRASALGGKRPSGFSVRERIFVETGSAALDDGRGAAIPVELLAGCLAALPALLREVGWNPAVVAGATDADAALASAIARALGVHQALPAALDPADRPLVVTVCNDGGAEWTKQVQRLARWGAGTTFALVQHPEVPDPADVIGAQRTERAVEVRVAAAAALESGPAPEPDIAETVRLAASPLAPWRRRLAGEGTL